jgi:hypothetical protein
MRAVLLTLTTCLFVLPVQAKYSGGSGTTQDPYQIATAVDLIALGETPADYDKHFVLTADIDLDPNLPGRKVFDKAVIAGNNDPRPGYYQGTSFSGVFDGNGHAISHLTIKGQGWLGLFGQLGSWPWPGAGEVRNLGVMDVNITGSGNDVGGLVGYNGGGSTVTQCHSTGTVSGASGVGGLVGINGGTVTNCYSTGAVSGTSSVGGLVGGTGGHVTQCYSTGAVSADGNDVGGLVGYNDYESLVAECYSTGAVRGTDHVGGLVGTNWGGLTRCYGMGAVRGTECVGGLVGWLGYTETSDEGGYVTQCYSTGTVSGTGKWVGGLVGGLVGLYDAVVLSFWDTQTSGQSKSDGGTGKTTAQMQTAKTFLDAGWDFVGEMANGSEDVWKISEGLGYPRLSWEKYSGGSGEPNDPYQIAMAADLIALGESPADYDKHFILTADIDLDPNLPGRKVFDKAVIAPNWPIPFTGVFDGKGHTISHLTITGGSHYLGLFGKLGDWNLPEAPDAEVKNLGVVDVNIIGSGEFVGALAGYNWRASVTHCHSTGVVTGGLNVGGLVGCGTGPMTRCYSTGAVSGTGLYVGGLVGSNGYGGTVTHCYSTGAVIGGSDVGGLVGSNIGGVTGCYSTGAVSSTGLSIGGLVGTNWSRGDKLPYPHGWVTNCFWDSQTSGQINSDGGIGLTTGEMQMAGTFLVAGWDFVGETANGTEDLWWILEGQDYPRLWWETRN